MTERELKTEIERGQLTYTLTLESGKTIELYDISDLENILDMKRCNIHRHIIKYKIKPICLKLNKELYRVEDCQLMIDDVLYSEGMLINKNTDIKKLIKDLEDISQREKHFVSK